MTAFNPVKYETVQQDVVYCTVDGKPQKMDVYFPSSNGPWACMIFIHGGGWSEGDKAPMAVIPTEAGILVVSINYRMYPAYRFPAMIEDVKCAIRSLRARAEEYNLDPARIILVGHSAGAHLAALAGLADESAGWDTGPHLDQSSHVQGVVALSGIADLTRDFPDWVNDLKSRVFSDDRLAASSPVTYVHKDAPPFLIIHGDRDDAVPVEQATLLQEALTKAGAQSRLLIIKNAGHGLEPVGDPMTPPIEEIFGTILAFMAQVFGL